MWQTLEMPSTKSGVFVDGNGFFASSSTEMGVFMDGPCANDEYLLNSLLRLS